MVKQPAAIIIARHGTRLDQADKNWRATAEHPYDPPLSYGGWIQCQTLGARIDKELVSLESQPPPADPNSNENSQPRKRRKIIIHSSPYKRCVQTSIAIAAGLRYPTNDRVRPLPTPYQRNSQVIRSSSGSNASVTAPVQAVVSPADEKIELKIDPCLGEWLSTSYFDSHEEPPPADIIVERAKETMIRPLEEIRGADLNAFLPVHEIDEDDDQSVDLESKSASATIQTLPNRTRPTQQAQFYRRQRAKTVNVYSPPVPQYSLAPQDSIPAGYVAHARDACVKPVTSWNSTELGWGDAGTYPEDWGVMHVRFRQALQKVLAYYENYTIEPPDPEGMEDELVLVLVTHQAGANALIRLMTGAPALHDVGVASLTLAVRRPVLRRPPSLSNTSHSPLGYDRESRRSTRRGSLDLGLADEFEMRIIASTDHLRMGSNPLGLNSPSLGPGMAGRRHTAADSLDGFSIGESVVWRSTASGMARSSSLRGRADGHKITTTGLWGSPATKPIKEDDDDAVPMSPKSRPTTPEPGLDVAESMVLLPASRSRSNTVQSAGLWGGGNVVPLRSGSGTWMPTSTTGGDGTWMGGVTTRNRSPAKRRWTAVSNSDS